jgi:hypothetical protein
VQVGDGVGCGEWLGCAEVLPVGGRVVVGPTDGACDECFAVRVAVAREDDDEAVELAECEAEDDRAADPESVAVTAVPGVTVEGLAPALSGDPSWTDCDPGAGVPEGANASAPSAPTATTTAAASANAQLRRDRLRGCRAAERRTSAGGVVSYTGAVPLEPACWAATASADTLSAGCPHPGQEKAPLRWRLHVEQ